MEENLNNLEPVSQDLNLDPAAISHLKETRSWTNFISIVGFVFLGLMLLVALAGGAAIAKFSPMASEMSSGLFIFIILVMVAIYFFPIYFLFNFSRNAKIAINTGNSAAFTEAMRYLKLHYRYVGIIMIIILSIYILALIFGLMAGGLVNMFNT